MAYFKSSKQLEKVLGGFFEKLFEDDQVGPKLKKAKLKLKLDYTDPTLSICCDTGTEPVKILINDKNFKPDVQLSMKADVAHRFWHGKVNLIAALTRKEMIAKGPIPKVLKLLPAIKPAYQLYPKYLEKLGLGELIIN